MSSCCQWLHGFVQERGHRFGGCNRNPIARTVHCFLAFAFFRKNSCYFNIGNIIWLGRLSWPMMLNSSYFTRHIYGELTGKGIRQWQRQSWCSGLCLSAGMRFTGESSLIFHGTPLGSGFQKTDEGCIAIKLRIQHYRVWNQKEIREMGKGGRALVWERDSHLGCVNQWNKTREGNARLDLPSI